MTNQKITVCGVLLLVTLTFGAYSSTFDNGYIWDDDNYVTNNVTLRSLDGLRRIWFELRATPQYYPLVHTTFWLEYKAWGLNPLGFHVTNVVLHLLNALLLWFLLRKLHVKGAWLAAAVFAVHPVHVESVAWITERKNVLSAFFYFSALYFYLYAVGILGSEKEGGAYSERFVFRSYAVSLVLFVCALLSKTVTCALPVAALLVVWWKRGTLAWRDIKRTVPFFAAGLMLGLVTVWVEMYAVGAHGASWDLSFLERCLVAGRALWFYAAKVCLPLDLMFVYPRWDIDTRIWWQYIFPAAAVSVAASLFLLRYRLGRGPVAAVLFFMLTLSPALGFVNVYPMQFSFVADHFQYIAAGGMIVLIVAAACAGLKLLGRASFPAGVIIAVPVIGLLAGATYQQGKIYKNEETLWLDTIEKNPKAWLAYSNLGTVRVQQGDNKAAISCYQKALEIKPDSYRTHSSLGVALANAGRVQEADRHLKEALRINPKHFEAHSNLGVLYALQKNYIAAVKHFAAAVALKPLSSKAYFQLGTVYMRLKRYQDALDCFQKALHLDPGFAAAQSGLRRAMQKMQEKGPDPG